MSFSSAVKKCTKAEKNYCTHKKFSKCQFDSDETLRYMKSPFKLGSQPHYSYKLNSNDS